mgnify:CR=1 FL=1|jgi:hypothetical protein|tara:strand:- start:6497 stop:6718 length:222 start_codon:yes stop_codon:yes gene_type:complete
MDRVNGNLLTHWVPIGAVLLAIGAAFSVGTAYAALRDDLQSHLHPAIDTRLQHVTDELADIKAMVARIDERTK